ncbi:uncharacterized protein LOC135387194 [Ornithodoros turicata]|uniref:uncharacterized protein LOC135387194 n=1 Tax=Ornithodoros turicata TaxID=34597 RepID=UPI003138CF35
MNQLFDCLNLQRPADVASAGPGQLNVIKDCTQWLDEWDDYVCTLEPQQRVCFLSKPTCTALRITLHSVISLVEHLRASGYRYVLTGKLGQDPLEKFFGIVRHVTGDGGRPTVVQFLYIYRMLSVDNIVKPPKRSNVEGKGPQLLLKLQTLFGRKSAPPSYVAQLEKELDGVLLDPAVVPEDYTAACPKGTQECILEYLGGYITHKFRGETCPDCLETLQGSQENADPHDLIAVKSCGFLRRPSPRLMKLIMLAEDNVVKCTARETSSIYSEVIEAALLDDRLPGASVGCSAHYIQKTAEVLHFFVRCRLHFFSREKNKKLNLAAPRSRPAAGGRKDSPLTMNSANKSSHPRP